MSKKRNILKCADGTIKSRINKSISGYKALPPFDHGDFVDYSFAFRYNCLITGDPKVMEIKAFLGRESEIKAFKNAVNSFKVQYFNFIKKLQKEGQK